MGFKNTKIFLEGNCILNKGNYEFKEKGEKINESQRSNRRR